MRRKGSERVNEVPLAVNQVHDVYDIYHNHPYMKRSRDAFVSMALQKPPEVIIHTLNMESDDELNAVLDMYWLPWLQSMYDWLKMIGICPWYYRRIRGTIHMYPCVPPWGSGYITTYLDKRHEQQFSWFWNDTQVKDNSIHFERSAHIPALNGQLTSPVASLIPDWKTQKIVRESTDIVAYQQARPQHIFEHHPPKNQIGDDNMTTLESFGEKVAADVMATQEGLTLAKMRIRTDALKEAIQETISNNHGMKKRLGTGPFIRSETQSDQWERENAGLLDHAVHLKPDFVYKPVQSPKLDIHLHEYAKRMDQAVGAIMDIPLQLTESSGKLGQNMQGIMRFINERVKYWLSYFETVTRRVFVMAYGMGLEQEMRSRTPYSVRQLYIQESVHVRIPVTPIATFDDLKKVYDSGLYNQHAFAIHTFNALGLPSEDIAIPEDSVKLAPQPEEEPKRPPKKARPVTSDPSF